MCCLRFNQRRLTSNTNSNNKNADSNNTDKNTG